MTGFDFGPLVHEPPDTTDPYVPKSVHEEVAKWTSYQKTNAAGMGLRFAARVGAGFIDANLGLVSGALDLVGIDAPSTLYEALPADAAYRLKARLSAVPGGWGAAADIGGHTLGFITGLPGKAVEALGAPAAALGVKVAKGMEATGKLAKLAQSGLPGFLGATTGFGLESLVATKGGLEERSHAFVTGMAEGAIFHTLSSVGNVLGERVLSGGIKETDRALLEQVVFGLAHPSDLKVSSIRKLLGTGAASAFEATGFSTMSEGWWDRMFNPETRGEAIGEWAGTFGAVMAARYGRPDAHLFIRRLDPSMNSIKSRLEAENIRESEMRLKRIGSENYDAPLQPGKVELERIQRDQAYEEWKRKGDNAQAAQTFEQTVGSVADTLFRSGWNETPNPQEPIVTRTGNQTEMPLYAPGSKEPIVVRDNQGTLEVTVPHSIYQQVRPAGEPGGYVPRGEVTLVGDVAKQFVSELTLQSLYRRIQGEILLGQSMEEIGAGMGWRGQDGKEHQIGMDGQHYSRSIPAKEGEGWTVEVGLEAPTQPNKVAESDPQIARWEALTQGIEATVGKSRELDVLKAAIFLAKHGRQDSPSVGQVFDLLAKPLQEGAMNADGIGPLLTVENLQNLAWQVGAVASGHSNAEYARMQLGKTFQTSGGTLVDRLAGVEATEAKSAETEAPKPVDAEAKPVEDAKATAEKKMTEIAGRQDWRAAPPEEAKAAAKDYISTADQAGVFISAKDVVDKFGVAESNVRRWRKEIEAASAEVEKAPSEPLRSEGESGAALDPFRLPPEAIEAAKETGSQVVEGIRELGALYAGGFGETLGRHGGEHGANIRDRARKAIDKAREFQDRAEPLRREAEKKLHAKGVREFLKKTVDTATGKRSFFTELVHGREVRDKDGRKIDVPESVAEAIKATQDFIYELGVQAEEVGVRRQNKEGQYVPFKATEGGKILPRTEGKDMEHIRRNDALRERFAEYLVSQHPGINASFIKEMLAPKDVKSLSPERIAAYESFRSMHNIEDVWIDPKTGKEYDVFNTNPAEVINRLFRGETMRAGTIDSFGQDLPKEVRKQLSINKPGLSEVVANYKGSLEEGKLTKGAVRRYQDRADKLALLLQGVYSGGPPVALGKIEGIFRSIETFSAFLYDVGDVGVAGPTMIGPMRLLRGLLEAGTHPVEAFLSIAAEARRLSSASAEAGELVSKFTDIVRAPGRWSEATKVAVLKVGFRKAIEDMKTGQFENDPWLNSLLRLSDFSPQERAAMLRGEGGKLYDAMLRRSVALATGNYLPGEGSIAHANKWLNYFMAYNRFFMGRMRLAGKLAVSLGKPGSVRAASTFLLGSMASGMVGQWLGLMLQQMDAKEGSKKWWREITNAWEGGLWTSLEYAGKSTSVNLLGGSLFSVMKGVFTDPTNIGNQIAPVRRLIEPIIWANGWGPYSGQDKAQGLYTLAERAPLIPKALRGVLAAAGVGEGDFGILRREVNSAKRDLNMAMGGGDAMPDIRYEPFRTAMRSIRTEIRRNYKLTPDEIMESLKPRLMEALKIAQGKDISQSLLGMRLMSGVDEERRDDIEKIIGPEKMAAVYGHDNALKIIAKAYSHLEGSDKLPRRPFDIRLENTVEQVRLGGVDSWKPLFNDVIENNIDLVMSGKREITEDLKDLAAQASALPETLREVLTAREYRALTSVNRGEAGVLLERLLSKKVFERARERTVEQRKQEAADRRAQQESR